jgi:uncharacterized metal-binding protein YceD (DUF177 family)
MTTKPTKPTKPVKVAWRAPVRRDDVPESGLHVDLTADEATRAAAAALAGVPAIPRLAASFDIARQGKGLRVEGEVTAAVEQTCVVTLEPMTSEIREPIDLVFMPPGGTAPAHATEEEIDLMAADEPEPLVDGVVDLGAVATEFLLLAIDPYPRKPDAVFDSPDQGDTGPHPFAALAALKKQPKDS